MTGRFDREVPTFEQLLTHRSLTSVENFRALGGLTLTVGPESEADRGFRHIAVEADDRNGAMERLLQLTDVLGERMKETGLVRAIIFSRNAQEAAQQKRDLHVLDAIATSEIIAELSSVMPVEGAELPDRALQAA